MNQLPRFAVELLNSPTYILMRVATMSGNLVLCFMPRSQGKVTCSVNTRLDYGTDGYLTSQEPHNPHYNYLPYIYLVCKRTRLYCNAILSYPYQAYIVNFTVSLFLDFIQGPTITVGLIGRHFRSPSRAALWLGTPLSM